MKPAESGATPVLWADRRSPRTGIKLRRATKKDQIHFIGLQLLSSGLHWGGEHELSRNGKDFARNGASLVIGSKHHSTFSEGSASRISNFGRFHSRSSRTRMPPHCQGCQGLRPGCGIFGLSSSFGVRFPENYWKSVRSMASAKA